MATLIYGIVLLSSAHYPRGTPGRSLGNRPLKVRPLLRRGSVPRRRKGDEDAAQVRRKRPTSSAPVLWHITMAHKPVPRTRGKNTIRPDLPHTTTARARSATDHARALQLVSVFSTIPADQQNATRRNPIPIQSSGYIIPPASRKSFSNGCVPEPRMISAPIRPWMPGLPRSCCGFWRMILPRSSMPGLSPVPRFSMKFLKIFLRSWCCRNVPPTTMAWPMPVRPWNGSGMLRPQQQAWRLRQP